MPEYERSVRRIYSIRLAESVTVMAKKNYTVTIAVTGYTDIDVQVSSKTEAEDLALKAAENDDLNRLDNIEWKVAGVYKN